MPVASIDVWHVDLALPGWQNASALAALSADEHARARRFTFDVHRRRFARARAALRSILAQYLDDCPAALRFQQNRFGKPALTPGSGVEPHFNLSHSEDLATIAVSRQRVVGIDIEHVRPLDDLEQLAGRFFRRSEADAVCQGPPGARPAMFYRCWTRKEAFVKGCGEGLHIPLDSFDVQPARDTPIAVTDVRKGAWTIVDVAVMAHVAAALAMEGNECTLTCQWWRPH